VIEGVEQEPSPPPAFAFVFHVGFFSWVRSPDKSWRHARSMSRQRGSLGSVNIPSCAVGI
jgi:hypothetical protein